MGDDEVLEQMRGHVLGLPDQLRKGLELEADPPIAPFPVKSILLVGMGGSAIGADLLLEWVRERLAVPAAVHRSGRLPAWVGEGDLVVAISYSGNTAETLEAARYALRTGRRVIAITTGGALARLGDEVPVVEIPAGMPPRTALGYLFSAAARLLEGLGLISASGGILEAADDLGGRMSDLQNEAAQLAAGLRGSLPTVYAYPPHVSVARRWSTQLNENAKMVAWWGALPEASHNQVEGWGQKDGEWPLSAVFLREPEEKERTAKIVDEVMRVTSQRAACHSVVVPGKSILARMFSGVVVGDLVSLEIAAKRGVNPREVPVIEGIKKAVDGG